MRFARVVLGTLLVGAIALTWLANESYGRRIRCRAKAAVQEAACQPECQAPQAAKVKKEGKAAAAPKVPAKPKAAPQPKPKAAEKPYLSEKPAEKPKTAPKPPEAPKMTVAPQAAPQPKPAETPKAAEKPAEQPKAAPQPKPAEKPAEKPKAPEKASNVPATAIPVPRNDSWWTQRNDQMNARVKQGNVDLLFIGDSITQGWEGAKDIWEKFYGKRNAVNLGIGGDQTQHVLWRLQNGNIKGIKPKAAVLMIGTNNSHGFPPEQIAVGVKAIVEELRKDLPQTKVLVLAIFPRGPNKDDPLRQVVAKTNALIASIGDGKMVRFLDIGPKFLEKDGTLSKEIMPDLLHLSSKGYQIWAEAIEPAVAEMMDTK